MTCKVLMFSSQPYDVAFFQKHASGKDMTLSFVEFPLDTETVALTQGHDAVCLFVNDIANRTVLEQLKRHGIMHVALRCAGFNNVDIEAAKEFGIAVSRVPGYAPEAVAEHAVALLLALNRKLHKAYNRVKEDNYSLHGLMGFNLHGKTAGIVGSGQIGAAMAKIMLGFGTKVHCYDPYPNKELEALGVTYQTLPELLSTSDIVSLHCPLTSDSYHMINAETLATMKQGVTIINTSRGGLIDTQAMVAALKSKKVGLLGLDVYEMESGLFFRDHSMDIIQDDVFKRLLTFPNVIVTGHQGFFTQEALTEIAKTTLDNIQLLQAAPNKWAMPSQNSNFLA